MKAYLVVCGWLYDSSGWGECVGPGVVQDESVLAGAFGSRGKEGAGETLEGLVESGIKGKKHGRLLESMTVI